MKGIGKMIGDIGALPLYHKDNPCLIGLSSCQGFVHRSETSIKKEGKVGVEVGKALLKAQAPINPAPIS